MTRFVLTGLVPLLLAIAAPAATYAQARVQEDAVPAGTRPRREGTTVDEVAPR